MKARLFITFLILAGISMLSSAQEKEVTQAQQTVPGARGVYVDANNNGICDTYENPAAYYRYGRGRGIAPGTGYGRGMAAGQGRGTGQGRGLARALPPSQGRGLGPAKGWGRGLGPGQGQGLAPGGRYYNDADKNGVCDTFEQSLKK